jgi:hypothetical protein
VQETLQIDTDLLAAAKRLALARNEPLSRVVSELLRAALAAQIPIGVSAHGFPVFAVPSESPVLTTRAVKGLLEED